jgi:hypothetical protein
MQKAREVQESPSPWLLKLSTTPKHLCLSPVRKWSDRDQTLNAIFKIPRTADAKVMFEDVVLEREREREREG